MTIYINTITREANKSILYAGIFHKSVKHKVQTVDYEVLQKQEHDITLTRQRSNFNLPISLGNE